MGMEIVWRISQHRLDLAFTGMVSESSCAKHPTVLDLCVLDGLVLEVLQVCHGMGPPWCPLE